MKRRPRRGRLPFLVLRGENRRTEIIVASPAWESGKPVFGFPLFHPGRSQAVGMWESRAVGEISKGRWEEWETCLRFSTLSTGPSFPQPWAAGFTESVAEAVIRSCNGARAWLW